MILANVTVVLSLVGRKPLALQALKERSLLQGRLDELGKYRLQLQSTSKALAVRRKKQPIATLSGGFTATAEIQSIVVEALSASTMMAKEQKVSCYLR